MYRGVCILWVWVYICNNAREVDDIHDLLSKKTYKFGVLPTSPNFLKIRVANNPSILMDGFLSQKNKKVSP